MVLGGQRCSDRADEAADEEALRYFHPRLIVLAMGQPPIERTRLAGRRSQATYYRCIHALLAFCRQRQ